MADQEPSSSVIYNWTNCDVFLSFYGEVTLLGFISRLYEFLCQSGIRVFIDDEGIRTGEDIITTAISRARQESRIAIIVFSENYAKSAFCLDELVEILECFKEEENRLIYPVFYHVDPSELRHPRGSYAQALAKLEERFKDNKQKVEKWRLALSHAADFQGFHLKSKTANEQDYITRITLEVATRVKHKELLHVTDYPVGLASRVKEVISYLDLWSDEEVKMIGICGAGGTGKSTIAKAVYNFIADNFNEGICFLSNVRKQSKMSNGLSHLQQTLLYKLGKEKDLKWNDYGEGISIIKHWLSQKKVLLILDDVDESIQLKALAGSWSWFGSGSRIIITTRDKQLLEEHDVESIYVVKELDDKESLKLFIWHAFKTENVDSKYMEVVYAIPDYLHGLPLLLEVIGSNLCGKGVNDWISTLYQLGRSRPRNKRYPSDVLKLSYDALEEVEKQVFLDLACFFNGEKLAYILEILSSVREIQPKYVIGTLIDKSLIRIEQDHVTMHDLIENLGKEIVRQESPHEPGQRSRIWFYLDSLHVIHQDTGTNKVEAIIIDFPDDDYKVQWSGEAFQKMNNLRILLIRKACFPKCPIYLTNNLRWLEWKGSLLKFSPNLPQNGERLVYLDDYNYYKLLPSLHNKNFYNLTCINLSKCKVIQEVPDLSGVPNLRELRLDNCKNLIEVHDSVGRLPKLRVLSVIGCKILRILPSYLKLTSPEHLNLWLFPSLARLQELSAKTKKMLTLNLSRTRTTEFPPSIYNLDELEILNMEKEKFQEIVGDNHLPHIPSAQKHLGQDVTKKLRRIRDFIHLMLSYPMRVGYEGFLEKWIKDAYKLSFADDDSDFEHLLSQNPLRYVQALIPKEIINGGTIKQVPQPILGLAAHLALHQLTQALTSYGNIRKIWFSTKSDARAVLRTIQRHFETHDRPFDDSHIIDLNQTDDQLVLATRRLEQIITGAGAGSSTKSDRRRLVLVVDGDGDKNLNPPKLSLSAAKGDSQDFVVFITAQQNDNFPNNVDLTIRTEDHFLPWKLFCNIVGDELLRSSNAIQKFAMEIVEKCGGHLLAIILMAKSLKNVTDVKIWEFALEKLHFRHRGAIVNAFFFNMIWANAIPNGEKVHLITCLMVFKHKSSWTKMFKFGLFDHWFSEQLVDSKEEAESILQNFTERSVLLQFEDTLGTKIIQLPEDIKIILQTRWMEIIENWSEGASVSTVLNPQEVLNLSYNRLQNLPRIMKNQSHVKELNLEGCMLKTLPEEIFRLHKLETLSLKLCCRLLELPPQIAKLENLEELRLAGCERLTTLPQEIWELQNLKNFSLPRTSIFPSTENQELINSDDLPLTSSIYHESSKKGIPSSSSAIIPNGFTLKLKAHRRFKLFEKFCQYIMKLQIQNLEKCDLSGTQIKDLPQSLNFPKLKILLLGNNLSLMKMPSSFFDCVPMLTILDLSRTSIHELPSSIFHLQHLRELYLKDCELFVELSPKIQQLQELVILDLQGTLITHLPKEIQELRNLEILSLSFYNDSNHHGSRFDVIPYAFLTKLSCLEVLRIYVHSDNEWWLKHFEPVLVQISTLEKLRVLDVCIPSIKFRAPIRKNLFNFRFIVGDHKPRMISHVPPATDAMFKESGRSLKFVNGQDFPDDGVLNILSQAKAFFLDRHVTINYLTQFGLKNLKQLQLCIVAECNEMQSIVDADEYEADSGADESFCMEILTVYYMKNLKSIINKPLHSSTMFYELKLLALHTCLELITIFTIDFLHTLVNLEELIVEDCPELKSIISCNSSSEGTTGFFLPRLRKLSLLFVPELTSISNGVFIGRNLEEVGFYDCPGLQSLSTAELSSQNLKFIRGEMEWWEKLEWSKAGWGQEDPPHKFSQIFSAIDDDLDIFTQLTSYDLMTSSNRQDY